MESWTHAARRYPFVWLCRLVGQNDVGEGWHLDLRCVQFEKLYILCIQILCTFGAHLPKLLAAVQSFQLPALCKHMLQLTHSFRAWACAFTCMKPFWKINIIDIHLKSLKPFSQIASGISWSHQPWHPMVRLCWGAAKGPGSSLWEEPSSRMATWMEGEEGLIEFCNRSQRGVLDLVIELIVFAEILAFLAQGCVWCIEFGQRVIWMR